MTPVAGGATVHCKPFQNNRFAPPTTPRPGIEETTMNLFEFFFAAKSATRSIPFLLAIMALFAFPISLAVAQIVWLGLGWQPMVMRAAAPALRSGMAHGATFSILTWPAAQQYCRANYDDLAAMYVAPELLSTPKSSSAYIV